MKEKKTIYIRPARKEDREFIISLIPRLVEFGTPPWRDSLKMIELDRNIIDDTISNFPSDTAIFVAEEKNIPLGFIHLQPGKDFYYKEPHAHISDVIVAAEGEGKGIGTLLMGKAEEWARSQGYSWLTLSVFAQNLRARELYERQGFGADIMRYVKEIG